MSHALEELRSMSKEELIQRHDAAATHTSVGVSYYLDELARRDAAEQTERIVRLNDEMAASSKQVERLTRVLTALTILIAILTAASLIAVIGAE